MATIPTDKLAEALERAYPELGAVRAASEDPVYLVGGAVRDLLLGRGRADIDLVVVGDAAALASRLGAEVVEHERFATAKARLDGHEIDVASARAETYPHPGALPEVTPAADIETDLRRRDFTINAMAVPLRDEGELIDPLGGHPDLEAGRLRILHGGSFEDDPTRAVRAARYAARFGFELDEETDTLVRLADLGAVSADRRRAELLRLTGEPSAPRALGLLREWGVLKIQLGDLTLAGRVAALLSSPPWREFAPRGLAVLAAASGPPDGARELAAEDPQRPSLAVELAERRSPVQLVLARAMGAEWLDRYLLEWRGVELEIDGGDLIAAGVPEGPGLGRGLAAAQRLKLDGEIAGRAEELAAALDAARDTT